MQMYSVRISKYNPLRQNTQNIETEWTSFSDVGKLFNDSTLSLDEYLLVEERYLLFIAEICSAIGINQLQIKALEDYSHNCPYCNNHILNHLDDIVRVACGCLREEYWCKLFASQLQIHFGYDYYIYIYSPLSLSEVDKFGKKHNLFSEAVHSPYLNQEDSSVVS